MVLLIGAKESGLVIAGVADGQAAQHCIRPTSSKAAGGAD